jgi:hypothetical protein
MESVRLQGSLRGMSCRVEDRWRNKDWCKYPRKDNELIVNTIEGGCLSQGHDGNYISVISRGCSARIDGSFGAFGISASLGKSRLDPGCGF